jgi:transcriptional regulator GlxA family with amidase domain
MLVRPADCPHSNDFAQGLRCLVVDVDDAAHRDVPEVAAFLQRNLELGSPGLDRLMRSIVRSLRSRCPTADLTIEGLMLQALAESSSLGSTQRKSRKPSWLETVLARLDDRFRDRIYLSELADTVSIHRIHLARTFRTHMGCTVGEYIRERRLEWAKQQLIATDKPISQIAASAGFADQSHLARLLRRDIGLSPTQLRAASRS